jgi:hypothetical protein
VNTSADFQKPQSSCAGAFNSIRSPGAARLVDPLFSAMAALAGRTSGRSLRELDGAHDGCAFLELGSLLTRFTSEGKSKRVGITEMLAMDGDWSRGATKYRLAEVPSAPVQ